MGHLLLPLPQLYSSLALATQTKVHKKFLRHRHAKIDLLSIVEPDCIRIPMRALSLQPASDQRMNHLNKLKIKDVGCGARAQYNPNPSYYPARTLAPDHHFECQKMAAITATKAIAPR